MSTPPNVVPPFANVDPTWVLHADGSFGPAGGGGSVTDVTATAPLASSGGATPDISITLPSDATKFLDGTGNFTTPAGGGTVTAVTGTAPIASTGGTTPDISVTDFDGTNRGVVPAGPADATKYLDGSGAFTVPAGSGGTVTSVTGTTPIASTGGATPDISIADFIASGASHARGAVPDPGVTPGSTKFLREDASWQVPAGGGTVTAVTATPPATSTGGTTPDIGVSLGTSATTACAGDDARLSDARTPTAHASTHQLDGDDVLLTPFAPAGSVVIPDGFGWYVPGSYEVAAGETLEIAATGTLEVGGNGTGTGMVLLASVTTVGNQKGVDFPSIPGIYRDLVITFTARDTTAAVTSFFYIGFNGDAVAANYTSGQHVSGSASTASAAAVAPLANKGGFITSLTAASSTANYSTSGRIDIPNYAGTTFFKKAVSTSGVTSTASDVIQMVSVTWKSQAAISRVSLSAALQFLAGSTFSLYGMR
jgi:hypothetical protein